MNTSEKAKLTVSINLPYWEMLKTRNTNLQFQSPEDSCQENNNNNIKNLGNCKA